MLCSSKLRHIAFIASFLASINTFSQQSPVKFGKVDRNDFEVKVCPIDSNAHAYFIFDYGTSNFEYADVKVNSIDASHAKGFQLIYSRHFQIKFVDNQDFSWAKFEIPLYNRETPEKILGLKAFTYNLVNGKVETTKLEGKSIYTEEIDDNWIVQKFEMPNVRAGSIIEIEYTIISDYFFNLQPWYFQNRIPILSSAYTVNIPEYFNYNLSEQGYLQIIHKNDARWKRLTLTYHQMAEGISVQEQTFKNTFDYREDIFHFNVTDVPAIKVEKHLRTIDNYRSKIEFELNFTKSLNSEIHVYTTDWSDIVSKLLESDKFGLVLKRDSHLKDDVETFRQSGDRDEELLHNVHRFIARKIIWNGRESKYVTASLGATYAAGIGNSADINLNLLVMLRELGFEAHPVVLSTQSNGFIPPSRATITSLNYVIVRVQIGESVYLLDATDQFSDLNILPIRCLNEKGLIINEGAISWVNLMEHSTFNLVQNTNLDIAANSELSGASQLKLLSYGSYQMLKENNGKLSELQFEKELNDISIDNIKYTLPKIGNKELVISYDFADRTTLHSTGDLVFFSPAIQPFVSENPFKPNERNYPIEYNHAYYVQQSYSYSVPDNYTIDEMPKPAIFKLPDNSASYIYNILQHENTIRLTIIFSVKKTLFFPEEYPLLKNFYRLIIEKQKEQVVLKNKK